MTDLEMTKLAAEAMGYRADEWDAEYGKGWWSHLPAQHGVWYNPLHYDAQAMALVKKFRLWIQSESQKFWHVHSNEDQDIYGEGTDLNRAIVECVAQSQKREGG